MNNRVVIPVPFGTPNRDFTIFIGDWYTRSHKVSVASPHTSQDCTYATGIND